MGTGWLYSRYLLPRLRETLADMPPLLVHGPQQCGKTTLPQMLDKHYSKFHL